MKVKGVERLMPCGKCVNCRKGKAYDWSVRIKNHMAFNSNCAFVTLTYEDPLSKSNDSDILSLSKRDLQLFFKRLRKFYKGRNISYFACGEYGDATSRPHYHILLFGISLLELKLEKRYNHLYSSIIKDYIWTYGNNEIGQVETRSIYYVTGYILKNKYNHKDMDNREPEFNLMSKNLGLDMLDENWEFYIERYLKRQTIPSYYYRMIKQATEINTTSSLLSGYGKQVLSEMKNSDMEINKSNYRKALKTVIESNLQKETDYNTLQKLIKGRPL